MHFRRDSIRPPDYLGRRVQLRLLLLFAALAVVLVLMDRLRRPSGVDVLETLFVPPSATLPERSDPQTNSLLSPLPLGEFRSVRTPDEHEVVPSAQRDASHDIGKRAAP